MKSVFREDSGHGLWCIILVPFCTFLSSSSLKPSEEEFLLPDDKILLFMLIIHSCIFVYRVLVTSHSRPGLDTCHGKEFLCHLFERNNSAIVRQLKAASKIQIPPKLSPSNLEEARRMRQFQKVAPSNLKLMEGQDDHISDTILFRQKRNEEEMLQLKRRLSERALHSTSSGFLLKADDQEIYLENLESFKIDVVGIFLALFSTTSLMIAYYLHEEINSNYRNTGYGFVRIGILLALSQLALLYIMPKLYLTYLKQFTLGEGILISHCIILFYYSNMKKIITGYSFSASQSSEIRVFLDQFIRYKPLISEDFSSCLSVFVIAKIVLLFLPIIIFMVKIPRLLRLMEKTTPSFKYLQNNYFTYKDILGMNCHFIPVWICNSSYIAIMTGLGWSILKYGISIFVKKHIGSKKIPETDTVLANFVTINIINFAITWLLGKSGLLLELEASGLFYTYIIIELMYLLNGHMECLVNPFITSCLFTIIYENTN